MLAAAAAIGAPLGHDFCAINLSDNLKPWALIEKRLRLAVEADFAMALYNPRSKARPEGFERTLEVLQETCAPGRLIIFTRAVATPEQAIRVVLFERADPAAVDRADRDGVDVVPALATSTLDEHQPGLLEDAEVLHHREGWLEDGRHDSLAVARRPRPPSLPT